MRSFIGLMVAVFSMQLVAVITKALTTSRGFSKVRNRPAEKEIMVKLPFVVHICTFILSFLTVVFTACWVKEKTAVLCVITIVSLLLTLYVEIAYRRFQIIVNEHCIIVRHVLKREKCYSWAEISRIEKTLTNQLNFYKSSRIVFAIGSQYDGYLDLCNYMQDKGIHIIQPA